MEAAAKHAANLTRTLLKRVRHRRKSFSKGSFLRFHVSLGERMVSRLVGGNSETTSAAKLSSASRRAGKVFSLGILFAGLLLRNLI